MLSIIIPIKDDYESLKVILREIELRKDEFTSALQFEQFHYKNENSQHLTVSNLVDAEREGSGLIKQAANLELTTQKSANNEKNSSTMGAISVVVVDDGSSQVLPIGELHGIDLHLIKHAWSWGHQESIVEGLQYCAKFLPCSHIVIMDGDGEDLVEDIPKLLQELRNSSKTQVVCAQRGKRDVQLSFSLGYFAFRTLFRTLTGKNIQTGNFMAIRNNYISTLMTFPNLSTNLAASVMRFAQGISLKRLDRGSRTFGKSKMNTSKLILHGYGAISVFADIALSRMIFFTTMSLVCSIVAIFSVLMLKVLGLLEAIPGWTSIVLLQALTLSLIPFYLVVFITIIFLNLKWKTSSKDGGL